MAQSCPFLQRYPFSPGGTDMASRYITRRNFIRAGAVTGFGTGVSAASYARTAQKVHH